MPFSGDDGLYNSYRSWQVTGTVNYDLDNANLTWVTNYNWNRNMFQCSCSVQESGTWASEKTSWRAFSSEARVLTSYDGPINVLIGAYYQTTKRLFDQYVITAGIEDSTATPDNRYAAFTKDSQTKGETISGYGQVIWEFLPKVELTAGARYTHETKKSIYVMPYVNGALTGLFVQDVFNNADQTFNNWSPEATVSWRPNSDINVYGAYKTGYKSGGFSISGTYSALLTTPYEDFAFDPEKAKGFEFGVKTTLLDNQLRFNVGLFRYKYTNLQVDFFNATLFAFQTINAGSAITKGIETEFEFAPRDLSGLTVRGSLNYTKARYKGFIAPCYLGQTPAQGCTDPNGPGGWPAQDLSGRPTSVAPDWTGTLGFVYEAELGSGLKLGLSADARYSGKYFASPFNAPLSRVKSYTTLDASARIGTEDDRWELALIGKNLTNRLYISGSQDGPSTGTDTGLPTGVNADQIGYGSVPRTVQLQLTFRY